MMVEMALDSAQDFCTSGSVPQWKRELLQRRAARRVPPVPTPPPPPAPSSPPDDEELRYGPGIVKRLQSRYLSLALRDTPNRPTVLRRAASLEHILDDPLPPAAPPPTAAARRARPVSVAAPPVPRTDSIKRARSVDALSRLEALPRAPRPPSRPRPLLRDTERPPVDLVRSALRKFEPTPARRAAPAARVSAVLRGLEGGSRGPTPERTPPPRIPSPKPPSPAPPSPAPRAEANINHYVEARNSNVSPKPHNVDTKANSISPKAHIVDTKDNNVSSKGRIADAKTHIADAKAHIADAKVRIADTKAHIGDVKAHSIDAKAHSIDAKAINLEAKANNVDSKLVSRAALEGIARAGSTVRYAFEAPRPGSHLPPAGNRQSASPRRVGVIRPMPAVPRALRSPPPSPDDQPIAASTPSQIVTPTVSTGVSPRGAPGGSTSMVFNFVGRRTVPDYVEDDGRVRTVPKSTLFKEGEAGVVLLRADALRDEADEEDGCGDDEIVEELCLRFVNDNVIINGRSSMHSAAQRRAQQLKLQFDDSLTRTHEYPSEASLCEFDDDTTPSDTAQAALGHNTRISSVSLGEYTPHKSQHDAFRLGLVAPPPPPSVPPPAPPTENGTNGNGEDVADGDEDNTRSWSDARTLVADLLF